MNLFLATLILGLSPSTPPLCDDGKGPGTASCPVEEPAKELLINHDRIYRPTKEEQERLDAFYRELTRVIVVSKEHLKHHRFGLARQLLEDRWTKYPSEPCVAILLADVNFRTHESKKAYQLLKSLPNATGELDLSLRESLAASLEGEVHEGQKELCLRAILDHFSLLEEIPGSLPNDSSLHTLRFLSGLAVGIQELSHADYESGVFYIEWARKFRSDSAVADELLGSAYMALKDYSASVKAFERGLPLAKGKLQERFGRELATARRLLAGSSASRA